MSIFNILDRDYSDNDLNLKNSFYKVFDSLTYQFIPKIVKETWINVIRKKTANYYDYVRSKNKHNPQVIADYYAEELNHYREAKDIISKYLIPLIKDLKENEKVFLFKKGYIYDEISKNDYNKIIGYHVKGGSPSEKIEQGYKKMMKILDIYLANIINYKEDPEYYHRSTYFFDKPVINRLGIFPDTTNLYKKSKDYEFFKVIEKIKENKWLLLVLVLISIYILNIKK